MRIRELSELTGASVRTLRYYELRHLLSSRRLSNGYRDFDAPAIERVRFIRALLRLGLNVDQIGRFVECGGTRDQTCPEAVDFYRNKLKEVENRLSELHGLRMRVKSHLLSISDKSAQDGFHGE